MNRQDFGTYIFRGSLDTIAAVGMSAIIENLEEFLQDDNCLSLTTEECDSETFDTLLYEALEMCKDNEAIERATIYYCGEMCAENIVLVSFIPLPKMFTTRLMCRPTRLSYFSKDNDTKKFANDLERLANLLKA